MPNCAWPGLVMVTPVTNPSRSARKRSRPRRPQRFQTAMRDAFDRALRTDLDERGRLDVAMRRAHTAAARAVVGVRHRETEGCRGQRNSLQFHSGSDSTQRTQRTRRIVFLYFLCVLGVLGV